MTYFRSPSTRCHTRPGRILVGALMLVVALPVRIVPASDHADPIMVRLVGRSESNLSGLFAFAENEKLVIALCANPGLVRNRDVNLQPLVFTIYIDCHSSVRFADSPPNSPVPAEIDEGVDRTFRYGGWIPDPEEIREDIRICFRFDQAGNRNPFQAASPGDPVPVTPEIIVDSDEIDGRFLRSELTSWTGLRDDPFILHGFSRTNVVAMVVEIPFSTPGLGEDFLIWGTCSQFGRQTDHVGRALRTMLPRFDFLNSLHPSRHVAEIRRRHENPGVVQDLMSTFASPFFAIRHYDFAPDVMIFSRDRWLRKLQQASPAPAGSGSLVAFPNGRRLTDDVAHLMCERGDCLLFEVSTAEAHADHRQRPVKNGRPFLDHLPWLAPPNEDPTRPEQPTLRTRTKVIVGVGLGLGLTFLIVPWGLFFYHRRKIARLKRDLRMFR